MDERKDFISRIGTFFLLLGALLVILFVATDIGDNTYFSFFFMALILLGLGWYFKRITAIPTKPSGRFEGLRKWQQKQREAKIKREAAKKAKKK